MSRQSSNIILVTGATGFLGHSLCPHLVKQGYRVRALVRPASNHAFLEPLGVELAWGDIRDSHAMARAVTGCRAVIHAAGKFRLWGKREGFFAINLEGTHNLLDAARNSGVKRFMYISTIAIVGRPPPGAIVTEETPCNPQDDYQESKLETERLVMAYYREYGLPAIILRPGAYYGPWGRYGFNRLFFEDPLKGLPLRVHQGRHIIFPAFVGDVAGAAELALTRARPGEVYNICGPCLTHRQVNETLERVLGRRIHWIDVPAGGMVALARVWTWLSGFTRREPYYPIGLYPYVFYDWPVSSEKARREMGFEPTPFEEGARATLEWYRQEGILRKLRPRAGLATGTKDRQANPLETEAMSAERREELVRLFERVPIARHFGMRLSYTREGNAVVDLPYNPDLDHGLGGIHGGVYATMLDTAGWFTAAATRDASSWVTTSEMSIHFLKATERTALQAVGRLIKRGKRQDIAEMHLYDEQGELVGHATGTFVILPTIAIQ